MALKRAVLIADRQIDNAHAGLLAGCTAAGAANLLGLLRQKNGLDVWQYTTLSDGHTRKQFVQLLVVADGQLEVTWNDTSLLVVTSGVAGQLEHFGGQVLHHGGQVDWSTGTDSLGVVSLAQQTVDSTDWELKTSTARSALRLSLHFASFASSRHDDDDNAVPCERNRFYASRWPLQRLYTTSRRVNGSRDRLTLSHAIGLAKITTSRDRLTRAAYYK